MTTIRAVPSPVDIQSLASPVRSGSESLSRKSNRSSPKQKAARGIERTPILPRRNIQQRTRTALIPKGQTDAQFPEPGNHEVDNEASMVPIGHAQAGSTDASCGDQTDSRDQDRQLKNLFKGPQRVSLDRNANPDQRTIASNDRGSLPLRVKSSSLSTIARSEYDDHIAKIIRIVKISAKSPFALNQRRPVQARLDSINRWSSSLDLQDVRESLLAAHSDTAELIAKLKPNLRALLPLLLLNLRAPSNLTKQGIGAAVNLVQRNARHILPAELIDS